MASKASKAEKDKAMAAELKRKKVKRTHARCCICNQIVALSGFYKHLALHK